MLCWVLNIDFGARPAVIPTIGEVLVAAVENLLARGTAEALEFVRTPVSLVPHLTAERL